MADDEQKLIREQNRGVKAKELIENELLAEAFADIRSTLVDAVLDTQRTEQEALRGRDLVHLLDKLRGVLDGHLMTGTLAAKQLLEIREKTRNPFNRR